MTNSSPCRSMRASACVMATLLLWSSAAVAQPPLLHWTFDEADGAALDTGTAPAADGVLQNNVVRTANTPGGYSAFALDMSAEGLESWVNAGDVEKVDTLSQFTMSTWILMKGLNSDQGGSNNVRLLAKQANTGNYDGFSWNLNAPNEGSIATDNFRLGMFVGGVDTFGFGQSTQDIGADDQWVFAAVTYDGFNDEDNLLFYFGDESSEAFQLGEPISVFAGEVNSSAGIANLAVGYSDAGPTNDFAINGYQDDVRIYDRILSIEELEQVRLSNLQSVLKGDFNNNGILDAADIDDLTQQSASGLNDPVYDVNQDTVVNGLDVEFWISDLFQSWMGDADLSGEFNSGDLVTVLASGTYEADLGSVWSSGDFNGDGRTNSGDLVAALAGGGYEMGPRQAVRAVPEPSAWCSLMVVASLLLIVRRR